MAEPIFTDARRSMLIADLMSSLGMIATKLAEATCWHAFEISDPRHPGTGYERLVCRDRLSSPDELREYRVGIHRFGVAERSTAMHDHRFPFAVFPFGPRRSEVVYEMPWEHRRGPKQSVENGVLTVRSGKPYAIHDCRVRHALLNGRSHFSVTIAEITRPPARGDRLRSFERTRAQADELRSTARAALRAALG